MSINGSECESFKDEESAVRAARDMAHNLVRKVRLSKFARKRRGAMGQGLALSAEKVTVGRLVH